MQGLIWALTVLNRVLVAIGAVLIAIMALHVVCDVGARYILGRPLDGTTEIVSRYYMIAIIFLPLAWLQAQDKHIAAGLLFDVLSERWQRVSSALASLLMAIFAALLGWRCAAEAAKATAISEKLQTAYFFLPVWPARWIIPLAAAILVLQAIAMLLIQCIGRDLQDFERQS